MEIMLKIPVVKITFILALLVSAPSKADQWTAWSKANSFHVTDAYADIVRVQISDGSIVNPAACENGDKPYVDIEINKEGRSTLEVEQMINVIYMSMATYRSVRLYIDGVRCSPDGFRLANGVGLNNS